MNKQLENELPEKPVEPDPSECCGRDCENCVYVYYERALKRWEEKVKKLKKI
jgi:oxidoreductase family protein